MYMGDGVLPLRTRKYVMVTVHTVLVVFTRSWLSKPWASRALVVHVGSIARLCRAGHASGQAAQDEKKKMHWSPVMGVTSASSYGIITCSVQSARQRGLWPAPHPHHTWLLGPRVMLVRRVL